MSKQAVIRLPSELIDPWRQALIRCAKLPRGINPKTHTTPSLMQAIVRGEADEVARLWSIFTQEREELSRHLLASKRTAVAYLLGFHLANAARAQMVLGRAHIRHPLAKVLRELNGKILWHDLGCGTGAVAQVVMHNFVKSRVPLSNVALHLSDMSGTLLDTATELFAQSGWSENLHTHRYPLEKIVPERLAPDGETALVGYSLGYVWNELARNKTARTTLLKIFEDRSTQDHPTLILVLEPAMQELAREAMQLRDTLTDMGYGVLYPCPQSGPCPLLTRTRDWCYSEAKWDAPPEILRLDEMLAMDRRHLSGAGYLLASPALMKKMTHPPKGDFPPHGAKRPTQDAIVVGRPDRSSGRGFDYLVCQPSGLDKIPHAEGESITLRGLPLERKGIGSPSPDIKRPEAPKKDQTSGSKAGKSGKDQSTKKKPLVNPSKKISKTRH